MKRARRTYWLHATRARHKVTVARGEWKSSARIRLFTLIMFQKIFGGLVPTEHYHIDGNLAGAYDNRGNHLYVDQINLHPATEAAYANYHQRGGPLALIGWKEAA